VACITRSEKGSVIQDAKRRYHIKAHPVDKVVDTTGAGDQYAAGVLAGPRRRRNHQSLWGKA